MEQVDIDNLDRWWQNLKVVEKERIASKIQKEAVTYPECSLVWISLKDEDKKKIHDHCTDKHGLLLSEWSEGKGMSY